MGRGARLTESTSADLRIQRGEEEVLENGPVIGIAGFLVIALEQRLDTLLDEQVDGDQPLLLDKPYEQQAGDETDDVFLWIQCPGLRGREPGFLHGEREPIEQLAIEPLVQLLGIQGIEPGFQQTVKVVRLTMGLHPCQSLGERQPFQYVHVGAVGISGFDLPYQSYIAQHVALRIAFVSTPMYEGKGKQNTGGSEQHNGGHGESLVDLPRDLHIRVTRIGSLLEFHRYKEEASRVPSVETREFEQTLLLRRW